MTPKRQNSEITSDANVAPTDQVSKRRRTSSSTTRRRTRRTSLRSNGVAIVKRPTTVGGVLVFGSGDTGQLGLGETLLERKKPAPVKDLDDKMVVDVACGGMHSVALTKKGELWSWGCNDQGTLGRSGDEYVPAQVEDLNDVNVVKVACSDSATMALSSDGVVYSWGTYRCAEGLLGFSLTKKIQETPALFEPLKNVLISDVSAGADHNLALGKDGRVFSWGNGQQFQLGRRVLERRLANGLCPEAVLLKNVKLIACGAYHSLAVTEENDVYAWGLNNYQQCGVFDEETGRPGDMYIKSPTLIKSLQGKGSVKSIHGGAHHSIVVMGDGSVYSFGRADSCQLGLPEDMIKQVKTVREGDDSLFKTAVGVPTRIPGLSGIEQLGAGSNHSIAIDKNGVAYTWGFGECYALGNGSSDDEPIPIQLTGQKLDGRKVLRASAGGQHSMILASF